MGFNLAICVAVLIVLFYTYLAAKRSNAKYIEYNDEVVRGLVFFVIFLLGIIISLLWILFYINFFE